MNIILSSDIDLCWNPKIQNSHINYVLHNYRVIIHWSLDFVIHWKMKNSSPMQTTLFARPASTTLTFFRQKFLLTHHVRFRCRPGPGPQHPAGAARRPPDVAVTLGHQGSLPVNSMLADLKVLELETGCGKMMKIFGHNFSFSEETCFYD